MTTTPYTPHALAGRLLALHGYSRRPLTHDEAARWLDCTADQIRDATTDLGSLLETPNRYAANPRYALGGTTTTQLYGGARCYQLSKSGHAKLAACGYLTRNDEVARCKQVRALKKADAFKRPTEDLCLIGN